MIKTKGGSNPEEKLEEDKSKPIKTKRAIFVNNLAESIWQSIEVSLIGTVVSSLNNLHPNKVLVEVDLASDAQFKQCNLDCHDYRSEDHPTAFQDSTEASFRRQFEKPQSGRNWHIHFCLNDNDAFLTGSDRYLLPGAQICLRLTQFLDNFVLMNSGATRVPADYSIKVTNATCIVHILELRHETH